MNRNKRKTKTFARLNYRQIQKKNSHDRLQLTTENQKWLKEHNYKNRGWSNVISLFKKIKELKDKENIKKLSLEELFIEADFVGNKYFSDQEINSRNLRIAQELNDIAEIIDAQFPDTTREIIDYSK